MGHGHKMKQCLIPCLPGLMTRLYDESDIKLNVRHDVQVSNSLDRKI